MCTVANVYVLYATAVTCISIRGQCDTDHAPGGQGHVTRIKCIWRGSKCQWADAVTGSEGNRRLRSAKLPLDLSTLLSWVSRRYCLVGLAYPVWGIRPMSVISESLLVRLFLLWANTWSSRWASRMQGYLTVRLDETSAYVCISDYAASQCARCTYVA